MANYSPNMEPENLKKKLKSLFEKLDSAYPDKSIIGLHSDHKQWGEAVTTLYRELGYPDGKSFLEAYGYQYGRKDNPGGRPKSVDPEAIIKEFQEKYPNGSPFKKAEELFAGTEYESKLKTIMNQSKDVFGMPLGKYLLSIGLLQPKAETSPKTVKPKKEILKEDSIGENRSSEKIKQGYRRRNIHIYALQNNQNSIANRLDSLFDKYYGKAEEVPRNTIAEEKRKRKIEERKELWEQQTKEVRRSIIAEEERKRLFEEEKRKRNGKLEMWDRLAYFVEDYFNEYVDWETRVYRCPNCYELVYDQEWSESELSICVCPLCGSQYLNNAYKAYKATWDEKEGDNPFRGGSLSDLDNYNNNSNEAKPVTFRKNNKQIEFKDKIFVLTGFSIPEEKGLKRIITKRGGLVKSSTVLDTDYLIRKNNQRTTKYKRALELNRRERIKQITILRAKEFYELVGKCV